MTEAEMIRHIRRIIMEFATLPDEKIKELMTVGLAGMLPLGQKSLVVKITADVVDVIGQDINVA